jgi:Flp pilus assembly protein TadG
MGTSHTRRLGLTQQPATRAETTLNELPNNRTRKQSKQSNALCASDNVVRWSRGIGYFQFNVWAIKMRFNRYRLYRNERGVSALEFAIISPVLLTILLGIFQFGIAMNDYLVLTNAAGKGALTIALGRGTTTPYTATTAAISAAAPNLTAASIATTVTINGTACSTDSACTTALVAGVSAVVRTTYPCNLTVMGINYAPHGCTLSAQTAQLVQ